MYTYAYIHIHTYTDLQSRVLKLHRWVYRIFICDMNYSRLSPLAERFPSSLCAPIPSFHALQTGSTASRTCLYSEVSYYLAATGRMLCHPYASQTKTTRNQLPSVVVDFFVLKVRLLFFQPCKVQQQLYIPPTLTASKSAFCPQCVY
jgi:hypothetical protein